MTDQADNRVLDRAGLRKSALERREAMTETARIALTRHLEEHLDSLLEQLSPNCLAFCWPFRAEPDLRKCVAKWLHAQPGRVAALPVVVGRAQAMIFRAWTPETLLEPDRHGIPHPPAGPEVHPDVVLIPLNAFDDKGYRIGYGGGYFDRTLAVRSVTAVGVGFEVGRVDSALPQAHDRPMQWIVTEAGAWPATAELATQFRPETCDRRD